MICLRLNQHLMHLLCMTLHYILLRVWARVGAINVVCTVGALDAGLDGDN
jgi:hypothetical protein